MLDSEYTCQCCMEVYDWFGAGALFGGMWLCLHCQPEAEVDAAEKLESEASDGT